MEKKNLLFYEAYEAFYAMAGKSRAFEAFCRDAYGEDFSQDGFSDAAQIDRILPCIPPSEDLHILDVGCGNGKMLAYLQKRTGAFIHGFDYSAEAIRTAKALYPENADFREGIIGQTEYPDESFDLVISMDTICFAKDMAAFVAQVKRWLKPGGVFFVGYQEGELLPKTMGLQSTQLARALMQCGMPFEATDITAQTYALLRKKRACAIAHRAALEAEGHGDWADLLLSQTDYAAGTLAQFQEKMARYLFVIRK